MTTNEISITHAAAFLAGLGLAFIIAGLTANSGLLENCRKYHNVYECIVIAIPKDKETIYQGAPL